MSDNITEPPKPPQPSPNDFEVHAKLPRVGEVKLTLYQETWDKISQSLQHRGLWVSLMALLGLLGVQSNFSPNSKSQIIPVPDTPKPTLNR